MIHWGFLVLALLVGVAGGFILAALLASGRDESAYRLGYVEGHHEGHVAGFKDGLAEWQKVG
jgi:hypothetical protein